MERVIEVVNVSFNTLMTIILIFGILFVVLFVIGIEPFVVVSGSMEPSIKVGSLCFINKHTKYSDIKVQDIIAYTAITGNKVTHRVVNITDEGMETKGDRNNISDGISVTEKNFIGKNVFSVPRLGFMVSAMQTPRGKIITITIAIVIFVAAFFVDDGKGKRVKKKVVK